jgi:hypothetical protein
VNKLFTLLALALLPLPAQAATMGLPATVFLLKPTADINILVPQNKRPRHGLALQGQSGQVIRYAVGQISGTVILDLDGTGSITLPKAVATDTEYMLDYD